MKLAFRWLMAFILGAIANYSLAYEVNTHRFMSDAAARASNLQVSGVLSDIGLPPLNAVPGDYINTAGDVGTALLMVQTGAMIEDEQWLTRPFNHFFDPQNGGLGLRFAGLPCSNVPSPTWAIEDFGDVVQASCPSGGDANNFSFRTAQQYYHSTLTASTAATRNSNAAAMFQSIGMIIHHVQDMAQPQHTRNDSHGSRPAAALSWDPTAPPPDPGYSFDQTLN